MNELTTLAGVFLGAFIALIGFVSGFYMGRIPVPTIYPETSIQPYPDAFNAHLDVESMPDKPEYVPFEDDGSDLIPTEGVDPGLDPANWDEAL